MEEAEKIRIVTAGASKIKTDLKLIESLGITYHAKVKSILIQERLRVMLNVQSDINGRTLMAIVNVLNQNKLDILDIYNDEIKNRGCLTERDGREISEFFEKIASM